MTLLTITRVNSLSSNIPLYIWGLVFTCFCVKSQDIYLVFTLGQLLPPSRAARSRITN